MIEKLIPYPRVLFNNWKAGNYDLVPEHLRDDIVERAKKRPSRYFAEMFILREFSSRGAGWYASHYGLFNRPSTEYGMRGYKKIMDYYGHDTIIGLQQHARAYLDRTSIWPTRPDLWVIDKHGRSHFIEVKRSASDRADDGQLAGLALIRKYLNSKTSIIRVYSEDSRVPTIHDYSHRYAELCSYL